MKGTEKKKYHYDSIHFIVPADLKQKIIKAANDSERNVSRFCAFVMKKYFETEEN
jgi:hypothetical protein